MQEGYSDSLTIERVDTNGNYCKDNCTWDTRKVQAHNRRSQKNSSSHYVGVSLKSGKYEANFCNDGYNKYLGRFESEYDAASAYDDEYEKLYGKRNNKTEKVIH